MRRRNQLVDTLLDHIRPVVERLAMDLAHIAAARIERELGRVSEAVEVALSTYASDRPDLITAALGPDLAAMLTPPPKERPTQRCAVHREVFDVGSACPSCAKEPPPPPAPQEAPGPEVRTPVRKPNTCSKCGYVGGTAYGCGKPRGHVTLAATRSIPPREALSSLLQRAKTGPDDQPLTAIEPPRRLKPTAEAIARGFERSAARGAPSRLRDGITRPIRKPDLEVDDNPNAEVRWSSDRIEHAKTIAESLKRDGELPTPLSSWEF
jgi:hypothetical protein